MTFQFWRFANNDSHADKVVERHEEKVFDEMKKKKFFKTDEKDPMISHQ